MTDNGKPTTPPKYRCSCGVAVSVHDIGEHLDQHETGHCHTLERVKDPVDPLAVAKQFEPE